MLVNTNRPPQNFKIAQLMRGRVVTYILTALIIITYGEDFWSLYETYSGFDNAEFVKNLVGFEEKLFTIPVILGFLLIMFSRINLNIILFSLFFVQLDSNFEIIDHHWHYFLADSNLYPSVITRGDPNYEVNVQYGVLSLYALIYLGLWVRTLWPGGFTFDRAFFILVASVMLGTTTLFHQVFIHNALIDEFDQARTAKVDHLTALINLPDAEFVSRCRAPGLICSSGRLSDEVQLDDQELQPALDEAFLRLRQDESWSGELYRETLPVGTLKHTLLGYQLIMLRDGSGSESRYRLAIDLTDYTHIPNRHKVHFTGLMIVAHSWWIGGGLLLLMFHRRRFKRRFGAVGSTAGSVAEGS